MKICILQGIEFYRGCSGMIVLQSFTEKQSLTERAGLTKRAVLDERSVFTERAMLRLKKIWSNDPRRDLTEKQKRGDECGIKKVKHF